MSLRRLLPFALAVGLFAAACSGARPGADDPPALLDAWAGLEAAFADLTQRDLPCADAFGTWFEEFGVRGLSCVAAEVVDPAVVVQRAGVEQAFETGPHRVTTESFRLDLEAPRAFGHYDPAFVRWAIANGIVGEGRPAVRIATQPVYDRHVRQLARLYWLAHADLAADGFPGTTPAGPLSDYQRFLDGECISDGADGCLGGFSVFAFTSLSEGLLPRADLRFDNEWEAKYEANTAYGFWVRRRADGTRALWHDGLRRLLATYDADWLASQG